MAQVKAMFNVPLNNNDGRNLSIEIEELRIALFIRFAGWSFLGYITGAYRMADGTRTKDVNAAYAVVLDDSRLPELEQALREFKSKTLQEAIYLEILRDLEVRFL